MTVIVEVPEGHKWCRCCGGVFPKDTGFYQQKKFSKAAGEMKLYPRHICKKCDEIRIKAARKAPTKSAQTTSLRAIATEIVDAAWLEAQVVYRRAGRFHWRARHRDVPPGAEIVGAYDKGARFDCVLADLSV